MADERNERSRSRSPIRGMENYEAQASRRIPGLRGRMVYADALGYTYVQNKESTNRRQLRCSRYEQGCRSTASMPLHPINAPIVMHSGHNHHYGHDIEIGAFNEALRQRALVEGTSARTIFEEEARRFPNAALEVRAEQALRAIRYIRRRSSPPIPENLRAMGDTILSPTWRNHLMHCTDDVEAPFFNGNLEFIENGEITFGGLVFSNLQFLQRFSPYIYQSRVLAVDGTFGVIPRAPGDAQQLVTIHVVLDNISVPVVYALLNRRTENMYMRLWQFLRNDFPQGIFNWENITIVADFETALRNAVQRVIPECRLVGCWFHFSQSIVRFIQTHNMSRLTIANHDVATIVRMIIALPHLPAERVPELPEDFNIPGAFLAITNLATRMGILNHVTEFLNYIRNYWINIIRPAGFTVYGLNIRTNNYVESFHSMLRSAIGRHPPVWTFYDRLRSVEARVRRETWQIISGQRVRRSIVTSRDTNNYILADALDSIRNGRYDTMAYLRRVAYSARGYLDRQIGQLPNEIIRDLDIQNPIRVDIQPQPPAPPVHVRGVRRPRGRGRQLVGRPDPVPADPPVVGNLDALEIFEDVVGEDVEVAVPGIGFVQNPLRVNIQPQPPAPPVHVRGVRRSRGRGRQLVERPDPVPADPLVVGNLDALEIFEDVVGEDVEVAVPGIGFVQNPLRVNIQPQPPAPLVHVRGVRRSRGRGRQLVERPDPVPADPLVVGNLDALEIVEDVVEEAVVPGIEVDQSGDVEIVLLGPHDFLFDGEVPDRCQICLENNGDIEGINIFLPCGHGWCCDACEGNWTRGCPICQNQLTTTQPIHIMCPRIGEGSWTKSALLLDPTVPGCLGCMRAPQYVPDMAQYILLNCGHGWYCSDCIEPQPETCEVCDDSVDGIIRMFLS